MPYWTCRCLGCRRRTAGDYCAVCMAALMSGVSIGGKCPRCLDRTDGPPATEPAKEQP